MKPLRFAIFGTGFWARAQLAAWRELGGVECVAVHDRDQARAEAFVRELGVAGAFRDPAELLATARPDFVDIITQVDGHRPLALLCARRRVPCICQKPMAATLRDARAMVAAFARTRTPLYIHENWRWQAPLRALIGTLRAGVIGRPFRARFTMISGFDVWAGQPALRELEQFILMDLGVHVLDTARACLGEAHSVACQVHRTLAPGVRGENVATLLLAMGPARTSVVIELAYAGTPLERECFPQTLAFVEGPRGSVELAPDYRLRVTTTGGTHSQRHPPPHHAWADPRYAVAQASMVPCLRDLRAGLRGGRPPETTGADQLRTMELVFAAYQSARLDRVVHLRRPR